MILISSLSTFQSVVLVLRMMITNFPFNDQTTYAIQLYRNIAKSVTSLDVSISRIHLSRLYSILTKFYTLREGGAFLMSFYKNQLNYVHL